jgi:hypothetical protein
MAPLIKVVSMSLLQPSATGAEYAGSRLGTMKKAEWRRCLA